jgi:membrane protease YdiL (CAAX protease family)
LKLGIIPIEWRFILLYTFLGAVILLALLERLTLKELGIRFDNLKTGLVSYLFFTALGLLFIFALAQLLGREPSLDRFASSQFSLIFIPISIAQEFIYRSYLMVKLKQLTKRPIVVITINALLFAFLHIIYPDPLLLLPVGLISGFGFAWMYDRYPNTILISISHMILNYAITSFCIFTITIQNC